MEHLHIRTILLAYGDIPDIGHRRCVCKRRGCVYIAHRQIFQKQRYDTRCKKLLIGDIVGKKLLQILPADLAAQALTDTL